MTQETDQDAPAGAAPQEQQDGDRTARTARRRRTPKQDALLVADVATARAAVEEVAEPSQIGEGHRVVVEEDRLVTHLFECALPGYHGWNWFATVARAPRSKTVTVCEVGLLPGEDALLAPEWVPWSERVSPEEKAQEEEAQEEQDREDAEQDAADREPSADEPAGGEQSSAYQETPAQDLPADEPLDEPAGAEDGEGS